MAASSGKHAVLLASCPDAQGIVADVTAFIRDRRGNILHLAQHVDVEEDVFFMRVEWDLEGFDLTEEAFAGAFEPIARRFAMTWEVRRTDRIPRAAIFVSKLSHCLYDLLSRVEAGEYAMEVPLIISNHPDLGKVADRFQIPFRHIPVSKETKPEAEAQQRALLEEHRVDLVILARYMQILSAGFVAPYPNRIINIHHSFLPAFAGARPYHAAYARGVKVIGATSHYVTADLDAGPIIQQDVMRVSHKDAVKDLVRKGKDLERNVLARAVWYHLQHRILVYNNKTVVFD